jgi:Flp pilus assembly protein CpaB
LASVVTLREGELTARVESGFAAPSVPTQRTRRARWRDGRLVLGVLLVAVTALVGSRLLATADDTTAVWVAKRAIPAGERLTGDDLTTVDVRFTGDESEQYVTTDNKLDGRVALRQIGAGELVPQEATAAKRDADRLEVPLAVAAGRIPADLAPGDLVDVWVVVKEDRAKTGDKAADEPPGAVAVWRGVQVVSVDATKASAAGSSSQRQVLVGLDPKQTEALATGLQQIGTGEPLLVRRSH